MTADKNTIDCINENTINTVDVNTTNETNINDNINDLKLIDSVNEISLTKKLNINNESETESDIDAHSIYTSRLPEPQPLYQYYMQQEQERLINEHSKFLAPLNEIDDNLNSTKQISNKQLITTPITQVTSTLLTTPILENFVVKNNLAQLNNVNEEIIRRKETNNINEENEVDSICDSNEQDDGESILVS